MCTKIGCVEDTIHEGKRPVIKIRHNWEVNIKMHVNGTVLEDVYWIDLTEVGDWWWADVNTVMILGVP
jgi:hypothetical protein